METVLPSLVLVMAMPMLGFPLVRVIEVDGARVCATVATSPSVMGVGFTVGAGIPVGNGKALLVPVAVEAPGADIPTTRCLRSSIELNVFPTWTGRVCPFELI